MKPAPASESIKFAKPVTLILGIFFCMTAVVIATPRYGPWKDSLPTSTQLQAIGFIDQIKDLAPSSFWPNIKPSMFLQNIRSVIKQPISIYPGNGTNFCGYGALTYLFLQDDPLGYTKLLLQLYREGKASFRNVLFDPSPAVKKAAGQLKFKGILDIHPAEQMWFLTLASHYKGYLNLFNRRYDPGDENTFWASCNYAKFNRMVRDLLHYKVRSKGTDLIRPPVEDLYQYINDKMETGTVVLFINNRIVHKKDYRIKLGVPTHFIAAEKISKINDIITLVYWDYGHRTQLQLSAPFFKRIIYGITYCTKKEKDEL